MVKVRPRYGKRYTKECVWYCKNYSIVTTSHDRKTCIKRHLEKLKEYGFIRSVNPFTGYDKVAMEFCRHPFKEEK